jgi:hypothetical protein
MSIYRSCSLLDFEVKKCRKLLDVFFSYDRVTIVYNNFITKCDVLCLILLL